MDDVLAVRSEDRLQAREGRVVGAHHGVEPPFLGFLRRARERRIDVERAGLGQIVADLRSGFRLRGRRVDHDEPGASDAEDAVLAVDDLLDLRRAGDAQDHHVGRLGELCIALRFLRPGGENVLCSLTIAVHTDRQRETLGDEILRHAVTHQTKADEADARFVGLHVAILRNVTRARCRREGRCEATRQFYRAACRPRRRAPLRSFSRRRSGWIAAGSRASVRTRSARCRSPR